MPELRLSDVVVDSLSISIPSDMRSVCLAPVTHSLFAHLSLAVYMMYRELQVFKRKLVR